MIYQALSRTNPALMPRYHQAIHFLSARLEEPSINSRRTLTYFSEVELSLSNHLDAFLLLQVAEAKQMPDAP